MSVNQVLVAHNVVVKRPLMFASRKRSSSGAWIKEWPSGSSGTGKERRWSETNNDRTKSPPLTDWQRLVLPRQYGDRIQVNRMCLARQRRLHWARILLRSLLENKLAKACRGVQYFGYGTLESQMRVRQFHFPIIHFKSASLDIPDAPGFGTIRMRLNLRSPPLFSIRKMVQRR